MIPGKFPKDSWILLFLLIVSLPLGHAQTNKRIAAFGSSVCNATGDETTEGGYVGRLSVLMKKYGFEVINVSRGGDNTVKIQDRWEKTGQPAMKEVKDDQYLLPANPGFVLIGLSLANEGLRRKSPEGRDSIVERFRAGMLGIIDKCRQLGKIPVVANCYPNSLYTPEEYLALKKMNLVISRWDVPSLNFLGCIDDGAGHWIEGFYRDDGHPSSGGHREMFFTIPPSLFPALEAGKPLPSFINSAKNASISYSNEPAFVYKPADTMHSFTVSFSLRNPGDVTLLKTDGMRGVVTSSEYTYKNEKRTSLSIYASSDTFSTQLKYEKGKIIYMSGREITREVPFRLKKDNWHHVSVTHNPAKGETNVFTGDSLLLMVAERIIPDKFKIGLRGTADYKDILIYRSALNALEIVQNIRGDLFRSSLEIYSPLNDESFAPNSETKNLAQSLSVLYIKGKVRPTAK